LKKNSQSAALYLGDEKILLYSAVNGHPYLASMDKLDHDQTTCGQAPMKFEAHFTILQNAAQQVDHENRLNKHPSSALSTTWPKLRGVQ